MSLQSIATAEAYGAALKALTGVPATVTHKAEYSEVRFSDPNLASSWIEQQLKPGQPGDVRVDLMPAVLPVVLKRAVPVALGILAVGYLLGKIR